MATCIFFSYSQSVHAKVRDDRELYEGVPNVDSGDGIQYQSTVTAPPHHSGHAHTLHRQKGSCMLRHT